MYTVLANSMPWAFTGGINGSFTFDQMDGGLPCVIQLRGTPQGAPYSIKVSFISGAIDGNGTAGSFATAPSGSPSQYASGINFFQELIGAFADAGGNVLSVVNLNGTHSAPQILTVPGGATQLQLGVNWGGGSSSFTGHSGFWVIGVSGIGPLAQFKPARLILNEGGVFQDRSKYVHGGDGPGSRGGSSSTSFGWVMKQS
jgi:hypothetical protein